MKSNKALIGSILGIIFLSIIIISMYVFFKPNNKKDTPVHSSTKEIETYKEKKDRNEQIKDIKTIKTIEGNLDEISLKKGIIYKDIEILGVKDENNFYGYNISGELCMYNTETKEIKPFRKAKDKDKYIGAVYFTDDWFVWVEDYDKELTDFSTGKGWAVYAENLKTNEIIEIDKDEDLDVINIPLGFRCSPYRVSISKGKVVYSVFERAEDNSIRAVIKMYDFTKKKLIEIEEIKDIEHYYFSDPFISDNLIVWDISYLEENDMGPKRFSDIIVYDIEGDKKTIISKNSTIYDPIIQNGIVAATLKPNGMNENTSIVLYDLNSNNPNWIRAVTRNLSIYDNKQNVCIDGPLFSSNYLIWWDNITEGAAVFNTKNNKFYILEKDGELQTRGLYKNFVFWKEFKEDITLTKYIMLKE